VASAQRRAYVTRELRRVSEQRVVYAPDRDGAVDNVAACGGEHGVRLMQRGHAIDVASVRSLKKESAEVLGLGGPFTVSDLGHSAQPSVVGRAVSISILCGTDTVRQAHRSPAGTQGPLATVTRAGRTRIA